MERFIKIANDILPETTDGVPTWLSIANIVASLLLTIVTIIVTIKINTNNQKFQKQIYNHDLFNQARQLIIDTYSSYHNAATFLLSEKDSLTAIFSEYDRYTKWASDFVDNMNDCFKKYNQLLLILNDKDNDLMIYLVNCNAHFIELNTSINAYITSGTPQKMIENAWEEINPLLEKNC